MSSLMAFVAESACKRAATGGLGRAWATAGITGSWYLVDFGMAMDIGNSLESTFSEMP